MTRYGEVKIGLVLRVGGLGHTASMRQGIGKGIVLI